MTVAKLYGFVKINFKVFHCVLTFHFRGFVPQIVRFFLVRLYAVTEVITFAQLVLRFVIVFIALCEVVYRRFIVLRHSRSVEVTHSQLVVRFRITAVCRLF